jgi:hypothetical protein
MASSEAKIHPRGRLALEPFFLAPDRDYVGCVLRFVSSFARYYFSEKWGVPSY